MKPDPNRATSPVTTERKTRSSCRRECSARRPRLPLRNVTPGTGSASSAGRDGRSCEPSTRSRTGSDLSAIRRSSARLNQVQDTGVLARLDCFAPAGARRDVNWSTLRVRSALVRGEHSSEGKSKPQRAAVGSDPEPPAGTICHGTRTADAESVPIQRQRRRTRVRLPRGCRLTRRPRRRCRGISPRLRHPGSFGLSVRDHDEISSVTRDSRRRLGQLASAANLRALVPLDRVAAARSTYAARGHGGSDAGPAPQSIPMPRGCVASSR
jgi:hypothetical protein